MHNAQVEKSHRLQRVLEVLTAFPSATSQQIQELACTVAPGTCISELRKNGYLVACERKGGIYHYSLLGEEIRV